MFQSHGHNELDTARIYGNGTTEGILAQLKWQERNLIMATKVYPTKRSPALLKGEGYTLSPADVRSALATSLKTLGSDSVDLYYLHGPDRQVPFEDTLREINSLYQQGKFKRFGISNFQSWEVAQICEICKKNDWVKPSVYQGVYNALQRTIEAELFPCLKFYGIALYAFQPLAGGFLTGRYSRDQATFEQGSRFDPKHVQGKMHQGRYWNDTYFDAIDSVKAAAEKNGLTVANVALRWLEHHSELKKERGDAIIVGASSEKHLEENLRDLEEGELPESVVEVMDNAWASVKGVAPKYWH